MTNLDPIRTKIQTLAAKLTVECFGLTESPHIAPVVLKGSDGKLRPHYPQECCDGTGTIPHPISVALQLAETVACPGRRQEDICPVEWNKGEAGIPVEQQDLWPTESCICKGTGRVLRPLYDGPLDTEAQQNEQRVSWAMQLGLLQFVFVHDLEEWVRSHWHDQAFWAHWARFLHGLSNGDLPAAYDAICELLVAIGGAGNVYA